MGLRSQPSADTEDWPACPLCDGAEDDGAFPCGLCRGRGSVPPKEKRSTIEFTYRGEVERWAPSRRSYRWVRAYSTTGPRGEVRYPWMTKSECRQDAARDGARAAFKETD